eukprot:6188711-Amphidinium_carterae.1
MNLFRKSGSEGGWVPGKCLCNVYLELYFPPLAHAQEEGAMFLDICGQNLLISLEMSPGHNMTPISILHPGSALSALDL